MYNWLPTGTLTYQTMRTCQNIKIVFNVLGKFPLRQLTGVKNLKMSNWQEEKEKFLSMSLDNKRKIYRSYTEVEEIPTWQEFAKKENLAPQIPAKPEFTINSSLNESLRQKVSLYKGDITKLEVDAIVNAANSSLLGGSGVDGAIHKGAGPLLVEECKTLNRCDTGDAKITGAYKLPAKYVIHTVGPKGEKPDLLQKCYKNSLKIMLDKELRSIAFPCIATGMYGYPVEPAAHIAVSEARKHLESHGDQVDRIIFCVFLQNDEYVYEGVLQSYFPLN